MKINNSNRKIDNFTKNRTIKRSSYPSSVNISPNNHGNINGKWEHDIFRKRTSTIPREQHKIEISNLDYRVTDKDIYELFERFGKIIKSSINYDRFGKSLGTAFVIYRYKSSAIQARNEFNVVFLDNREMRISVVENKFLDNIGFSLDKNKRAVSKSSPNQMARNEFNRNPIGDRKSCKSSIIKKIITMKSPENITQSLNNNNNKSNIKFGSSASAIRPHKDNHGKKSVLKRKVIKTLEELNSELDEYMSQPIR